MAESLVLLDVNALVSLALTTHQHHRAAHRYLAGLGQWATCPMTESAMVRLLLNPAVTGRQRDASEVFTVLNGMRADTRWTFLEDSTSMTTSTIETLVLSGHQQVTDLHLVNLAAHHGAVLATFDGAMPTWLAPRDRRHVVVIPA